MTQVYDRKRRAIEVLAVSLQGLSQIEAQLGREVRAALRAGIEARALSAQPHDEIGVALKARGHGPLDLERIVDIDVAVDHKDVLAGAMSGECRLKRLAHIIVVLLVLATVLVMLSHLIFLTAYPQVFIDEPWDANVAWTWLKTGVNFDPIHRGVLDQYGYDMSITSKSRT